VPVMIGADLNLLGHREPAVHLHESLADVGTEVSVIEVHPSNLHAREESRHRSHLAPVARGVVVGVSVLGHERAFRALVEGAS
jgi:3-dehydroquinate dehydratase-2